MKHYTSICNSAPSEILSLIALKNQDKILERNNLIIQYNIQLLDEFMSEYNNLFSWIRPQGGCVGLVNYLSDEPVQNFCSRLLHQKGVLLMPGAIYDLASNHFRIGYGRKNMPEALQQLKSFLQR